MFGDTNAVHTKVKGDEYVIDKVIEGETVADVLEYVQFMPKKWLVPWRFGPLAPWKRGLSRLKKDGSSCRTVVPVCTGTRIWNDPRKMKR